MTSNELKPCPFCGGEATNEFDSDWGIIVRCVGCGAIMVKNPCNGTLDVVKAWNTRAERTCHVEDLGGLPGMIPLLACDACGEPNYARADGSVWNYCPNCGAKVIGG